MTRKKIDLDELEKALDHEGISHLMGLRTSLSVVLEAAAAYLEIARGKHPELVIVPREPTYEMKQASSQKYGSDLEVRGTFGVVEDIYKAAIKSAPGVGEG